MYGLPGDLRIILVHTNIFECRFRTPVLPVGRKLGARNKIIYNNTFPRMQATREKILHYLTTAAFKLLAYDHVVV